ncbi:hypothetical protein Cantr_07132 [Candida viswanathii]|uniref:Secreted protein n=1 Tax=Candida viswanathii TaxID=5486 RepID=A0A367XZ40_9ASCO|nr:hypothetical protein Cantr_07132 [Candida viswanathii]
MKGRLIDLFIVISPLIWSYSYETNKERNRGQVTIDKMLILTNCSSGPTGGSMSRRNAPRSRQRLTDPAYSTKPKPTTNDNHATECR